MKPEKGSSGNLGLETRREHILGSLVLSLVVAGLFVAPAVWSGIETGFDVFEYSTIAIGIVVGALTFVLASRRKTKN